MDSIIVMDGEANISLSYQATAGKWNLALLQTIDHAKSEKKVTKENGDMRKFSVKYWKERADKAKKDGPSPVDRALAHLVEENEVKSLHGISKDSPELFLLTTALLHGLREALKVCCLWTKVTIQMEKVEGLKVADSTRMQASVELYLKDKSKEYLPKAVASSDFKVCKGGEFELKETLDLTLPTLLHESDLEVQVIFRTEDKKLAAQVPINLTDLLRLEGSKKFEMKEGSVTLSCKTTSEADTAPDTSDFNAEIKYEYGKKKGKGILELPMETPELKDGQFKFYSPRVFQRLSRHFGIKAADFYDSICNNSFVEFISNSKSGAFFFFSNDGRYMIKTIEQGECKCLRQMLPKYYEHCIKNPKTLLCRFYGLFRLRTNKKTHYFIIMESVFFTPKYIHLILDLKGSTTNRFATEKDLKAKPTENFTGTILKDNDIRNSDLCIDVGHTKAGNLRENMRGDVNFLSSQGIIDYSMLVGIHYPDLPDPREKTGETQSGHRRLSSNYPLPKNYRTEVQSLDGKAMDMTQVTKEVIKMDRMDVGIAGKSERKEVYFIGIIDILIQFGIFKGGEYLFKAKLRGEGEKISVIPPEKYASRFLKFMNFFIKG
ncbi:hypothetical protein AAMO2058_001430000 [Amorphochlora amoebiformis]